MFKLNGVGSFYTVTYTLCESSKFVGCGSAPICLVFWVTEKLSVVKLFVTVMIEDSKGFLNLGLKFVKSFAKVPSFGQHWLDLDCWNECGEMEGHSPCAWLGAQAVVGVPLGVWPGLGVSWFETRCIELSSVS